MSDVAIRITDPTIPVATNTIGAVLLIEQGGVTKQLPVEIITSSEENPFVAQYWLSPDGHTWKITRGNDGQEQQEDLGII